MELLLFSFTGIAAAFGAMALGVLLGRGPLARGCRGLDQADEACRGCERQCPRRRRAGPRS